MLLPPLLLQPHHVHADIDGRRCCGGTTGIIGTSMPPTPLSVATQEAPTPPYIGHIGKTQHFYVILDRLPERTQEIFLEEIQEGGRPKMGVEAIWKFDGRLKSDLHDIEIGFAVYVQVQKLVIR